MYQHSLSFAGSKIHGQITPLPRSRPIRNQRSKSTRYEPVWPRSIQVVHSWIDGQVVVFYPMQDATAPPNDGIPRRWTAPRCTGTLFQKRIQPRRTREDGEHQRRCLTNNHSTNTPSHGAQRTRGGACTLATISEISGRQTTTTRPPTLTPTYGETLRYEFVDDGDEPTDSDPMTLTLKIWWPNSPMGRTTSWVPKVCVAERNHGARII
jgi:hypothetical protein